MIFHKKETEKIELVARPELLLTLLHAPTSLGFLHRGLFGRLGQIVVRDDGPDVVPSGGSAIGALFLIGHLLSISILTGWVVLDKNRVVVGITVST